ncbi:MAG: exosortase/archaeosortase family protein [archaeon]|jgi:exosortase/archaeosortase family protein
MVIKRKVHSAPKKEVSIFDKFKNFLSKEEDAVRTDKKKQFVFFVLGFLVSYLLITAIIGFIPQIFFKSATGSAVQVLLSLQGVQTQNASVITCNEFSWFTDYAAGECYSFFASDKQIIISWLCTGILEIIILISAILASFGVNWNKKLIGIGAAIVAGVVFNLARIWITVNFILTQQGPVVELAHDVLFRIVLFIYIVLVYVLWFTWAAKEKNRGRKK